MKAAILLASVLLTACVGGTFGNHEDIEAYPLRGATDSEGAALKKCLRAAHHLQEKRRAEKGSYYRKASDMPLDSYCQGFLLAQNATPDGYEIMAQFHENESTVRWTVNQSGVIEEHLGPEFEEDMEF